MLMLLGRGLGGNLIDILHSLSQWLPAESQEVCHGGRHLVVINLARQVGGERASALDSTAVSSPLSN